MKIEQSYNLMIWELVLLFYLSYTSYSQLLMPNLPITSQMPIIFVIKFCKLEGAQTAILL